MKLIFFLLFGVISCSTPDSEYQKGLQEEEHKIYMKCVQEKEFSKRECKKEAKETKENFDKFIRSFSK